jgi:hypothetical protein
MAQWLGINGKRHLPLGAVLLVAPLGRLGLKKRIRALAECRLCRQCHAGFALRLDGVFPLRDDLAGFVSLLTSLGESGSVSAQPHFPQQVNLKTHLRAPEGETTSHNPRPSQ